MKKLVKKINIFGLGLVLVGGVVFATQSAFTSRSNIVYYYDGTQWKTEADVLAGLEEGEMIECTNDTGNCKAEFLPTADPNDNGPGAPAENFPQYLNIVDEGTFTIVPAP